MWETINKMRSRHKSKVFGISQTLQIQQKDMGLFFTDQSSGNEGEEEYRGSTVLEYGVQWWTVQTATYIYNLVLDMV